MISQNPVVRSLAKVDGEGYNASVTELTILIISIIPQFSAASVDNSLFLYCLLLFRMQNVHSSTRQAAVKPKMWLMKVDDSEANTNIDSNDIRPSCECTCSYCKITYDAYIDEKAMTKVLQQRLDESQNESSFMIEQVKAMEDKYNTRIEELESELADKIRKMDFINAQLETERRLRMEEMYKLEFQKDENDKQGKELKSTRNELINAINALPELEHENKLLKQKVEYTEVTILRLNTEMKQYNYELAKMEDANTRLRLRLHDSDTQINQFRMNNSSLNSHGNSSLQLKPIKSLRTTSVPINRSFAKS